MAIANAGEVSRLRVNRMHVVGLGSDSAITIQFYLLDRPPHKTQKHENSLDEAVQNLEHLIDLGDLQIDMSRFIGVSSRFGVVENSLIDQELLDYNIKYEHKTVIDGHSDGAFAGVAIGSIIAGAIIGLASISLKVQN